MAGVPYSFPSLFPLFSLPFPPHPLSSTLTFYTLLLRKGDKYSCITLFEVRKLLVMYMRCYAYVVQQVQSYHEVTKIDGLRCWDTTNVNC